MKRRRLLVGSAARIAEIKRENLRAARAAKKCPGCGCTRGANRCVLAVRDAAGELVMAGLCVPAGELPGHKRCSGCLTPELKVDPACWRWAGPDQILLENAPQRLEEAIATARAWAVQS